MNANKEVREQLIKYLKENGVKLVFISEKTGIANDTLSKWKRGIFDLRVNNLVKIKEFLEKNVR